MNELHFPCGSLEIDQIAAALAEAQGEIQSITKNKTGKVKGVSKNGTPYEYEYDYADLDALLEQAKPIAKKHGLALFQAPVGNFLRSLLLHKSGQWLDYGEYPLGSADKHQDRGGAISFARRYVASCIYQISTQDDDAASANEQLGNQPEAVFKTPAEREKWFQTVAEAISKAQTPQALTAATSPFKPKIKELASSKHADDKALLDKVTNAYDFREKTIASKPQKKEIQQVIGNVKITPITEDEIPFS